MWHDMYPSYIIIISKKILTPVGSIAAAANYVHTSGLSLLLLKTENWKLKTENTVAK